MAYDPNENRSIPINKPHIQAMQFYLIVYKTAGGLRGNKALIKMSKINPALSSSA